MSVLESAWKRADPVLASLQRATWLPLLLLRVFVGGFFFETGLGKVGDLGAMTERFAAWGIPAPAFNAALSGVAELACGALVAFGLITRLASIPMVINMAVAVVAVKLEKVTSVVDFVELDEPLYALAFLLFVFTGPGKVSLDHLFYRLWKKSPAVTAT